MHHSPVRLSHERALIGEPLVAHRAHDQLRQSHRLRPQRGQQLLLLQRLGRDQRLQHLRAVLALHRVHQRLREEAAQPRQRHRAGQHAQHGGRIEARRVRVEQPQHELGVRPLAALVQRNAAVWRHRRHGEQHLDQRHVDGVVRAVGGVDARRVVGGRFEIAEDLDVDGEAFVVELEFAEDDGALLEQRVGRQLVENGVAVVVGGVAQEGDEFAACGGQSDGGAGMGKLAFV